MGASFKKSAKRVQSNPSSSSCVMITNLPSPILTEILCRVPIKTLMASKSVCKSWLHLIRDPHFSQLHQARAPTEICFHISGSGYRRKLHLGNFHSLNDIDPLDVKLNDFPRFTVKPNNALNYDVTEEQYFFYANSCNGLLCYYGCSNKYAVVWNPSTSEFITFPESNEAYSRGYGLGFSRKANKFKLLRIIRKKEPWVYVAEICTIEEAYSWKTVCPCVSNDMLPSGYLTDLTFFQGALHWVAGEKGIPGLELTIQTFDFEDDQFRKLPLPPYFGKTKIVGSVASIAKEEVGVLAGCLVVTDYINEGVHIWLMKEYGVQDSWTKLFCLGVNLGKRLHNYKRWKPVAYMDNGEILMTCTYFNSVDVCFFNPILKSVRVIGSGPAPLEVITYRPSLVLLKDSVVGYEVHVKPSCAVKMCTSPDWWKAVEKSPQHQHGSALETLANFPW